MTELSAVWRRIPLRQCQECPKLIPIAQERCKSHEQKEPLEYVIRDSSGAVLDRWVESDE